MNKVILIGNTTKDLELTTMPSGTSMTRISLAVKRPFGDDETDFFDITVWGNSAENCAKYLHKGDKVAVVGRIQNRSYEDSKGNKKKITEIVAENVEFLNSKKDNFEQTKLKDMTELDDEDADGLPF